VPDGPDPPPLARLLGLALAELTARLRARLAAAGFDDQRPAHDAVFAHLPPEGITLSELARRAGISKQAMSELVVDLEAKDYVARRRDPADRRVRIIEFTPRGWAAIRVALAAFDEIEHELVDQLGAPRIASLRSVLSDLLGGRSRTGTTVEPGFTGEASR
jgi:MarR family transcriptional regulator, temperature-dependent positive regulator of motility